MLFLFNLRSFTMQCVLSRFSCVDSLQPYELWPTRFLCPRDLPGKNTGVGCCALLQEIFLTHGLNLGLLHCRQILYRLSHQGNLQFSSVVWSCLTLCDPIDSSPPGTPVPEILQARTLEWVAISFSRGSSPPRD